MIKNELESYLTQSLQKGKPAEELKNKLLEAKWKVEDIDDSLAAAEYNLLQLATSDKLEAVQSSKPIHANIDKILLIIGASLVVFAGCVYSVINWNSWGSFLQILAIFIPMLIMFAIGQLLSKRVGYERQGLIFMVVAALVFPFLMVVIFNDYKLFTSSSKEHYFMISLSSFIVYLILYLLNRISEWFLLTELAGLAAYIYGMGQLLLGTDPTSANFIIIWGLFSISIAMIGWGYFMEKNWLKTKVENQNKGTQLEARNKARYNFDLGMFVLALSLLDIIVYISSDYDRYFVQLFLLIMLGLGLIWGGLFYEKNQVKIITGDLILIGFLIFLYSLISLVDGTGVIFYWVGLTNQQSLVNGAFMNMLLGLFFIAISPVVKSLVKSQNSERLKPYITFFTNLGAIWILYYSFILSANNQVIWYDLLTIIISAVFIVISVWKEQQSYLVIGAIFLVIEILSMTFKYLKQGVSWPILLFLAGLFLMSSGLLITKIQRTVFSKSKKLDPVIPIKPGF
jgi:hypothetical protein